MMNNQLQYVLIYQIDNFLFGISIEEIIKVLPALEIKKLPTPSGLIEGFIVIEEEMIPVYNLRRKLQLPEPELSPHENIILFRLHSGVGAFRADKIHGTEYIFRNPGEGVLDSTDELILYKNLTLLDEKLIFVPNPARFLREIEYINIVSEIKSYVSKE